MNTKTQKSRAFHCVLNNYSEDDIKHLKDNEKLLKQTTYYCFGTHVGEKTHTPHIHFYGYFPNGKTFDQLQKLLKIDKDWHIQIAKGNGEENRKYINKQNTITEYGKIKKQGERSDIENIKKLVSDGATMNDLINVATSYQSLRTGELLMKYQKMKKRDPPLVKWYYGDTGTGKTRQAFEELGYEDTWISNKNLQWWDGYYGQKNIILDDFRGDFCTFHELLRITDIYPYRVMIKGSSCWLNAENIIITSPYHPNDIYDTIENKEQLLRRITIIQEFVKTQNPEVGGNSIPRPQIKPKLCILD